MQIENQCRISDTGNSLPYIFSATSLEFAEWLKLEVENRCRNQQSGSSDDHRPMNKATRPSEKC